MKNISTAVNDYFERAQPFARPVLDHLRNLVHVACSSVQEAIKWGMPAFLYQGKLLCSMAAHKHHCSFSFWKGAELPDPQGILRPVGETSMGQLGKITQVEMLPHEDILIAYIQQAMKGNDQPVPVSKPSGVKKEVLVPDDFMELLKQHPRALAVFERFSTSHRKEYIEWITEAKKPETRLRRMEKALEMLAEGKDKNHTYQK
jgi:uncharacterized protein YdeI (YjbR/CyaY-like superfamily)